MCHRIKFFLSCDTIIEYHVILLFNHGAPGMESVKKPRLIGPIIIGVDYI